MTTTLMTRAEMLERLEKKEDPLDLSIEKWERIVVHLGELQGEEIYTMIEGDVFCSETCALCFVYDIHCHMCSIYIKYKQSCGSLGYGDFIGSIVDCDEPNNIIDAADHFLQKLKAVKNDD